MTQATAPTTSHHVATIDLGARGTADVYIREAGMIDIDMPTRNGFGYTVGADPVSMAHTADQLEAGDSQGLGELTPAAMTALATALRAGIRAEAKLTSQGTLEDSPTERRNACPSWCDDREAEGHWMRRRGLWETLHARRFGPVTVYLPHEIHDDGLRWHGQSEVVLRHEDHQQQMDGESALTVAESSNLATHLRDAARFGVKLDQHLAAQAAQGVVSLDPSVQGEQVSR